MCIKRIKKATREWQLYLTRSSIVYIRPTGCGCRNYNIPLSYIKNIKALRVIDEFRITVSKQVNVYMEPDKLREYMNPWNSGSSNCCDYLDIITFNGYDGTFTILNVNNAAEFVAAVKREMG